MIFLHGVVHQLLTLLFSLHYILVGLATASMHYSVVSYNVKARLLFLVHRAYTRLCKEHPEAG
jgi:hypothetical protein